MRGLSFRSMLPALLVAMVLAPFVVPKANAGVPVPYTKQLGIIEAGAIVTRDTCFVTDEGDTARTTAFDFSDLDWQATLAQGSVATGFPIAKVTFVVTKANNGVSDTLHFNVEDALIVSERFTTNSCASCRVTADTLWQQNPLSLTTPNTVVGGIAVAPGGLGPINNVFEGWIMYDPDVTTAINNNWLTRKGRLVFNGDYGGSSPKLSGVQVFITYLRKQP